MSADTAAPAPASTPAPTKSGGSKAVSIIGILVIVAGAILTIAGGVTWSTVQSELKAQKITVSQDAASFAGQAVNGPFTAYAEAEVINEHAMKASGGKTYAELSKDDPKRETVMTASFLRASLFTSVVAFGVAAMAMGLGVIFVLIGVALMRVAKVRS